MAITKSLYSVNPGVLMTQNRVAALKGKTGRSLDEWIALVQKSRPPDENPASHVKTCPCQTIVPLYRRHVFAEIQRITHRIPISTASGIDDEVQRCLPPAYEENV